MPAEDLISIALEAFFEILGRETRPEDAEARDDIRSAVTSLAAQALAHTHLIGSDVVQTLRRMIVEIDRKISAQLDPILHHHELQQLEASWRGLWYLCSQPLARDGAIIKVISLTKRELMSDQRLEFWKRTLVQRIYVDAVATPGGEPFGAILADFAFGTSPPDLALLRFFGAVGALANVSFVGAASPSALGLSSFAELGRSSRLVPRPDKAAVWKSLRSTDEARHVSLAMPRVLMRQPYRRSAPGDSEYAHEESIERHEDYLWARAIWIVGDAVVRSFASSGWFAGVAGASGPESSGGLARHAFPTDDGGTESIGPTEVALSYQREKEIAEAGYLPVVTADEGGSTVINWARTLYQANALDRSGMRRPEYGVASDLRAMLCASRFAQAVAKLWHAPAGPGSRTPSEAPLDAPPSAREEVLQRWLAGHVARADQAPDASRPLREASVRVERLDQSDAYGEANVEVWPAYQFEASDAIGLLVRLEVAYPRAAATQPRSPGEWAGEAAASPLPARPSQPFELLAAIPCANEKVVVDAFMRSLAEAPWLPWRIALGPLTIRGLIDATRPMAELAQWVADGEGDLEVEIPIPDGRQLADASVIGFLGRYPSGAVRGISAELRSTQTRTVLMLLDPLALLDPDRYITERPQTPLACEFDLLIRH